LASLIPNSAVAGGPAFVLTARGYNFTPSSTIHWIGNVLPTTYVSANQLQANIPASYIATAGTASVTVWTGDVSTSSGIFTISSSSTTKTSLLNAISPSSANSGGAGFILTAYGSNLTSDSVVQWNGATRATTCLKPGQLQAKILASDIAAPGVANVRIYTPEAGTTSSLPFKIIAP
jgi:hypothetical protein